MPRPRPSRLDTDRDYEQRFIARHQAKVDRSAGLLACWPWIGATNQNGYGTLRGGRGHISDTGIRMIYQAHRVALAISTCPVGMTVFQFMDLYANWAGGVRDLEAGHRWETCQGNRGCCNPAHLEWLTHRQNTLEMVARRDAHDRGQLIARGAHAA